jgi:hypothetical protein
MRRDACGEGPTDSYMRTQERLAAALLRQAGPPQGIHHMGALTNTGITNHMVLITLHDGARVLLPVQ